MAEATERDQVQVDTEQDRFPNVFEVLQRMISDSELTDGPVQLIEITTFASGEACYRVWPARAEEPEIGYFPEPA